MPMTLGLTTLNTTSKLSPEKSTLTTSTRLTLTLGAWNSGPQPTTQLIDTRAKARLRRRTRASFRGRAEITIDFARKVADERGLRRGALDRRVRVRVLRRL